VICEGVIASSQGKQQASEMLCDRLQFSSACAALPFHSKTGLEESWDTIRQHQHLRSKSQSYLALLRVRSRLVQLIHEVMSECDLHNIVTPLLTQNDCEGGGEVFQVQVS
jgi:asparaginyl-tRNA synthetase